jgi:antibiotic biosynthesis monooxygenase (ABM) superfamily enzyme
LPSLLPSHGDQFDALPGRAVTMICGSDVPYGATMTITRLWRGWTTLADAEDYEGFLLDELFPSMRSIPGFLGADVLRRPDGEEAAFITLTRFRCLDDISAFAGDPVDVPVIEPRAAELLVRFDERAQHYETTSFM